MAVFASRSKIANSGARIRAKATLVTGACGEIGSNLLHLLAAENRNGHLLLGLDVQLPAPSAAVPGVNYVRGDITDPKVFAELSAQFDCETIYHLAAILSALGERDPERAYAVNCDGTLNVLAFANSLGSRREHPTRVIFPSTIAAYGIASVSEPKRQSVDVHELKRSIGPVSEDMCLQPITMYGINKLASEHLGRYFSKHYRLLASDLGNATNHCAVDFRCIRLPGVLSANTLPTGGTSDYASEMIHSAAQGNMYQCFARPRTTIPFVSMPDAVRALLKISEAPAGSLGQQVYNVSGFSVSAQEIAAEVKQHFPDAAIVFKACPKRMQILDSWPEQVDDSAARRDWGWQPQYDFRKTFRDYLIPGVRNRYQGPCRSGESVSLQAGM